MAVTFKLRTTSGNTLYVTNPSFYYSERGDRVFVYLPGRGSSLELNLALVTEQRLQAAFKRAYEYGESIDMTHPDYLSILGADSSVIFWKQENHLPSETAQAVAEILSVKPPV